MRCRLQGTGVDPRFQGCPGVAKLPLVLRWQCVWYIHFFVLSGCCLLVMPALDVVVDGTVSQIKSYFHPGLGKLMKSLVASWMC